MLERCGFLFIPQPSVGAQRLNERKKCENRLRQSHRHTHSHTQKTAKTRLLRFIQSLKKRAEKNEERRREGGVFICSPLRSSSVFMRG